MATIFPAFINCAFVTRHSEKTRPAQTAITEVSSEAHLLKKVSCDPQLGSIPSSLNSALPFALLFWVWELPFKTPHYAPKEQASSQFYR